MKLDLMTGAAVAFAAFAAYAYLKPKTATQASASTSSGYGPLLYDAYGSAANQHAAIQGAAGSQNLDYLNGTNYLQMPTAMGFGSLGIA